MIHIIVHHGHVVQVFIYDPVNYGEPTLLQQDIDYSVEYQEPTDEGEGAA